MKFPLSHALPRFSGLKAGQESFVPEGKRLLPEGKRLLPEGKRLLPEGKRLLPEGKRLLPEGNESVFSRKSLKSSQNGVETGFYPRRTCRAFSLVEILVVVSLLSLIVLALMAVFSTTQRAFRAAVTQSDVLEGSRAAVELMTADLRGLTPSGGGSNYVTFGAVNFFSLANNSSPLVQSLPGSTFSRTNLLNYFFVLGRENTKWTSTAYIVDTSSSSPLYPLYRFYAETNTANSPWTLYNLFVSQIQSAQWHTNMSHIIDGVVHLTARAYDTNGVWINNNNSLRPYTNAANAEFVYAPTFANSYGEVQLFMYSNTVPAAVELELGVLEDRTRARAESLPFSSVAQGTYLAGQSGAVHVFRQRVSIPNVDPSAYQ
jgi:type II secretory pathway pseudopilin PulG